MKQLYFLIVLILITSCVPIKIAPKFEKEDYKVMLAKKFQRKLPRQIAFIFKDPKDADEFYNFVNKKYQLNHVDVGINVPFQLENETLYLSYHEVEHLDKRLILPFVLIDAKRESNGNDPIFDDDYMIRKGHWYLILTVYDEDIKNCLREGHPLREKTVQYLKDLKQEYLTTQNYEELLFTKKS